MFNSTKLRIAAALALAALPMISLPANARAPMGGAAHLEQSHTPLYITAAANSNGRFAADQDRGPARADDRMSQQGLSNTNGPNATDRDKGPARAADRRGKHGSKQSKAK